MQASSSDDEPITGINVTPLVDIILVVLIIFMATAPMIQKRAIKVDMPQAASHERGALEALSVVYNDKREIFLSGEKTDEAGLRAQLESRVAAGGGVQVTMSADKGLAYQDIVGLLDVIRAAGVRKVGLEVQAK